MKKINILEEIKYILSLTGNPFLVQIFEKYGDNERKLSLALKEYSQGLYEEIQEENLEEGEEEKKTYFSYIYLNGITIDYKNISRIESYEEYNQKKNRIDYSIKIYKKYPSPLEEEYFIYFDSEEERDRGYEILKGKLKLCKIFIV